MYDATLQRCVYKTIANDDVILCPYRTLPSSIGFSSVQKKNAVDNLLAEDFTISSQ